MIQRFPGDRPEAVTERSVWAYLELTARERAWLRYQRWRFERGLLTEFPGTALRAATELRAPVSLPDRPR